MLSGGSIFVNNATSLGTNAAAGALSISGTVDLASANAAQTIALATTFTGPTTLSLGLVHPNNTVTLSGAMNLNGQNPTFNVAAAQTTDTISGAVSGSGGFNKTGQGILSLTTANTFTGPITVNSGLLLLGNAAAFGGVANAGADYTVATAGALNMNALPLSIGSLSGGGLVTNSGAAQTLTIGAGSDVTNATFSGSLAAGTAANLALAKIGTNTQTLTGLSYYAGTTTVSGGTLAFNTVTTVGGGASALGAPTTVAQGTVTLSAGTLQFVGSSPATTDRVIALTGIAASLDASGAAPITFSNPVGLTQSGPAATTFTLTGTSTATNTFNPVIGDVTGFTTAVTKSGGGTWLLTGANTYSGPTTVQLGKLLVGNPAGVGSLGASPITVQSGGTLGGSGTIAGPATINAGGTLAPGNSPGVLTTTNGTVTLNGDGLSVNSNSNYGVVLVGNGTTTVTPGVDYNQLRATGAGTAISGTANLQITYGNYPAITPGSVYYIVDNNTPGATTLQLADPATGLPIAQSGVVTVSGVQFMVNYQDNFPSDTSTLSNDISLTALTPEPGTLSLVGAAAIGLLARRRRRSATRR